MHMLRVEKIVLLLKNETAKSSEIRLANTYIPSRDVFSEVSVLPRSKLIHLHTPYLQSLISKRVEQGFLIPQ